MEKIKHKTLSDENFFRSLKEINVCKRKQTNIHKPKYWDSKGKRALKTLKTDKVNFHFYIGGYGEIDELKKLIDKYKLNEKVTTLGFVNKYKHSNLLGNTDIFIAPFFNNLNFSSNLSNKFIESIQYNLPILTPLKKDVSRFILKNKIGDIYKEKNYKDLVKKIKIMIIGLNKNNSTKMNLNRLSNNDFNHHNNYSKFLSIINILNKT